MKIKTLALILFPPFVFLFPSCVTNKGFERNFKNEQKLGRNENSEVFVITKNGKKIEGKKLTYSKTSIWKVTQKESWIAVDGQKINDGDYNIYQTTESYRILYSPDKNTSFFIDRLRAGKINLYYYVQAAGSYHNPAATGSGGSQEDIRGDFHVYVFDKANIKAEQLTFDNFSQAVSDNPEALQKLRQLYPKSKIPRYNEKGNLKNLIEVVEIYNKS